MSEIMKPLDIIVQEAKTSELPPINDPIFMQDDEEDPFDPDDDEDSEDYESHIDDDEDYPVYALPA